MLTLAGGERLAFSTDSFVVQPLRFPGGSIGHLAVHGTVNDLAMHGGSARWLSAAFVIEEGFPIDELRDDRRRHGRGGAAAGVAIVTGDTKVVDRGTADGLFITTAGVGVIPAGRELGPERGRPGDVVLVSGTIADHGMAVMLARGDLALEADIRSDTAPLGGARRATCSRPHRGPGGCATRRAVASAPCATSWLTTTGLGRRARRGRRSRSIPRWSARATCSASIRCTSPTKAS